MAIPAVYTMPTCSVLYGYLQSSLATCSVLWIPVVYYGYLQSTYLGYLQSTMVTCSLLRLPVVYCGYTHSLLSVLPRLLYAAIHYYVSVVFITTTSVLLSLYYLHSLPMLLSALLTHSCIPCLVYT